MVDREQIRREHERFHRPAAKLAMPRSGCEACSLLDELEQAEKYGAHWNERAQEYFEQLVGVPALVEALMKIACFDPDRDEWLFTSRTIARDALAAFEAERGEG